jgi:2-polyprenyl-6-methoxyphenol hydroxylase-like FAD-dependent oxidoreductase
VRQSTTRSQVPGGNVKTKPSGKSAFRFLVPREVALSDPQTAPFAQRHGQLIIWYGRDRRVIMYPCDSNRQLNFVCVHPREESQVSDTAGELSVRSIVGGEKA